MWYILQLTIYFQHRVGAEVNWVLRSLRLGHALYGGLVKVYWIHSYAQCLPEFPFSAEGSTGVIFLDNFRWVAMSNYSASDGSISSQPVNAEDSFEFAGESTSEIGPCVQFCFDDGWFNG